MIVGFFSGRRTDSDPLSMWILSMSADPRSEPAHGTTLQTPYSPDPAGGSPAAVVGRLGEVSGVEGGASRARATRSDGAGISTGDFELLAGASVAATAADTNEGHDSRA